jgi:hypothetical protein
VRYLCVCWKNDPLLLNATLLALIMLIEVFSNSNPRLLHRALRLRRII